MPRFHQRDNRRRRVRTLYAGDAFLSQCRDRGKTDYIRFDRTPLYRQMAMLERELRLATGVNDPIKLTVAQMLATPTGGPCEID